MEVIIKNTSEKFFKELKVISERLQRKSCLFTQKDHSLYLKKYEVKKKPYELLTKWNSLYIKNSLNID